MKRTIIALAISLAFAAQSRAAMTVYRIEVSTPVDTPIFLASGPGALYGIDCSSGATTSFAMAFDAGSASGVTFTSLSKAISPTVFSNGNTASSVPNAGWKAGTGNESVQFSNGLVGLTHGGTINCLFKVGPTNGSYP